MLSFTQKGLEELERRYRKAVKDGKESFMFQGQEIVTAYAKHLLEHPRGKA